MASKTDNTAFNLRNPICAQNYDDKQFSILAKGRSTFHLSVFAKGRSTFHLSVLEVTFIKTLNPILCRQKEFVYNLITILCSYNFSYTIL